MYPEFSAARAWDPGRRPFVLALKRSTALLPNRRSREKLSPPSSSSLKFYASPITSSIFLDADQCSLQTDREHRLGREN